MFDKKLLLIAALLMASCTSDKMTEGAEGGSQTTAASHKIINTSFDAVEGSLLVYFNDAAISDLEVAAEAAAKTRSAATRSGIVSVDDVLSQIQVSSLSRVFPVDPRSEVRARAAGLHKWYELQFSQETDLEAAAHKLAAVAEVTNIQFNTKEVKMWDGKSFPLRSDAAVSADTRAITWPLNDPELKRQWHYINHADKAILSTAREGADINVEEAWALTGGDPRIVVAVVDEGVQYTHPDLAANMWANTAELNGLPGVDDDKNGYVDDIYGYNFAENGPITWNKVNTETGKGDSGHGTHVAGTVAAVNNNGLGVAGVAGGTGNKDGVRIMSCQVLSGPNYTSASAATSAKAIKYAADNGASIIQCSMGSTANPALNDGIYASSSKVQLDALTFFMNTSNCDALDGGLVIYAAGNDATGVSGYPGAYREFVSVTSFAPDFLPASYTNYGPGSNIAAPGGDLSMGTPAAVLSTMPSELNEGSNYGYMQGTSMACPHVSGVAALGLSYALAKGKHFTRTEFNTMLLTSVNDMERYLDGSKGDKNLEIYRKKMGTGAVDAYQLLMQIEGTPCLKVGVGAEQMISLTQFFGASASDLTYLKVTMSAADKAKLGITTSPTMSYGKLKIKCTKAGVAKISVTAIAGGGNLGSNASTGGMSITKEFAIIARGVQAENGGWL